MRTNSSANEETPSLREESLPAARRGRRFGSYFVDAAIVAMASMIVFAAAGAPIFGYYEKAAQVDGAYRSLVEEAGKTHLLGEGAAVPSDSAALERVDDWLIYQIEGRYDEDFLLFCDLEYLGMTLEEHNLRFLGGEGAGFFVLNENGEAALSSESIAVCRSYIDEGKRDEETNRLYDEISWAVLKVYQDTWVDVRDDASKGYQGAYIAYFQSQSDVRLSGGEAALVSYFLTAGVYYMALPFLVRRGRSFPKHMLHLEVVTYEGKPPSVYQVLSRGLTSTLESLYLLPFAPFFFLSFESFTLPCLLFPGFEVDLYHVALIGLLLTLVSGLLTFFTKYRSTLHDLTTFTRVVEKDDLDAYLLKFGDPGP